jgi:hypothetical protein
MLCMKLVALFIALLFLLSYFAGMGQPKAQEVNTVGHAKKIRDKRNVFNLYSDPNYSNSVSMGLSLTRKIEQ